MGFENLTEKLTAVFKRLGSKGRLIEEDINAAISSSAGEKFLPCFSPYNLYILHIFSF